MDGGRMELQEYKEFLFPELETYNKRMTDYLEKKLAECGLINRISTDENEITLDKIKKTNTNVLIGCINHLEIKGIKFIEEWEFKKSYEYSVLFEATNLNKQHLLSKLLHVATKFNIEDNLHEAIYPMIKNPTYIEEDDLIILKFSLFKEAFHPQSEEKLKIKYPIIVVFYTNDNVVEIRYGTIKGFFVDDYHQFYSWNLKQVNTWIFQNLEIVLDNFLLEKLINDLKENEDVRLDGQDMRFSDGGTARLQVGHKVSDPLPLLGELKKLISENEEFSESIAVQQLLETWIKSKEDEAEYKWISLCWPHKDDIKWKNVTVKFQFDYFGPDVCLLYHYSGPVGMERMNSVTRYIIKNRDCIEGE